MKNENCHNRGQGGTGKSTVATALAAELAKQNQVLLVDAAAGIGCPVIASVAGSDYVIAVTEPTPAGLNDLQRALQMVDHFNIPYGIVINKHGINQGITEQITELAGKNRIPILSKIPYHRAFVEALVNLTPLIEHAPSFKKYFEGITKKLKHLLD